MGIWKGIFCSRWRLCTEPPHNSAMMRRCKGYTRRAFYHLKRLSGRQIHPGSIPGCWQVLIHPRISPFQVRPRIFQRYLLLLDRSFPSPFRQGCSARGRFFRRRRCRPFPRRRNPFPENHGLGPGRRSSPATGYTAIHHPLGL